MLIVGLTGGIGSGKSDSADIFSELGVPIIDADLIARELVDPGQEALEEIRTLFGAEVIKNNGTLDRELLRNKIFASQDLRTQLEAILHPRIKAEMLNRVESLTAPYCILVIPLLIDTGNWQMIDRILVIDVDEEVQVQRVMERDHQTREQTTAVLDAQISRQERLTAADDIINNNKDHKHLRENIFKLHEYYLELAKTEKEQATTTTNSYNTHNNLMTYEQPLNERIRTLLKLESLFQRTAYYAERNTPWDAHALINTLIEIVQLTSRGNLKSDLIKEIERQHAALKRHQGAEEINQHRLTSLLDQQQKILSLLHNTDAQLSNHLKADALFSTVNQRISIAGSSCDFDIPAYYHWLHLPDTTRQITINGWLKPYQEIQQAISLCLATIRESAESVSKVAEQGFYEHALSDSRAQLMRVAVIDDSLVFPEISAGRHRFSVRFFNDTDTKTRPSQCKQDINFTLTICGI